VKIAIVPIGSVDPVVIAGACLGIQERFGGEVQSTAPIAIPEGSFDVRRNQFSAVALMLALARMDSNPADRLVGVTECDLFIPMLTFVFGQAQLRGRIALVSTARLRQEFYGVAPDSELLEGRLEKEIAHELGHSFGLIHCPDRECVMSLATSIQEVDRKTAGFCQSCSRLAQQEAVNGFKGEKHESEMADSRRR
jgi:archaemetzincin